MNNISDSEMRNGNVDYIYILWKYLSFSSEEFICKRMHYWGGLFRREYSTCGSTYTGILYLQLVSSWIGECFT